MTGTSRPRASTTTAIGGGLLALAGLLQLAFLLGSGGSTLLVVPVAVAQLVASVVLALGPGGIVGASRVGRVALVLFGAGPLAFLLPLQLTPAPIVFGMTVVVLTTIATTVVAVTVAASRVLHGVARWAPVLLAADAVLTATMSSVPIALLPSVYLGSHLELLRPAALLVWGVSIALHGRASAIRGRGAAFDAAWKRSTDVGGTTTDPGSPR